MASTFMFIGYMLATQSHNPIGLIMPMSGLPSYSVGDMVERVVSPPQWFNNFNNLQGRRGIIISIDEIHMKVYWFDNGVTELYFHRIVKDVIKVVNSG